MYEEEEVSHTLKRKMAPHCKKCIKKKKPAIQYCFKLIKCPYTPTKECYKPKRCTRCKPHRPTRESHEGGMIPFGWFDDNEDHEDFYGIIIYVSD